MIYSSSTPKVMCINHPKSSHIAKWYLENETLGGGWTNPLEKNDRQVGSFPQGSGWKKKMFELPPPKDT